MPDITILQKKLKQGYKLTPSEEAFATKMVDSTGTVNRRMWQGIDEYPKSVIDVDTERHEYPGLSEWSS